VEQELLKIINSILEQNEKEPISQLDNSMSLREDLGFDSLDLAQLTVIIEDKFGVDIFEDGIVDTIQEVINKIRRK
jgi:acyl carrier protein